MMYYNDKCKAVRAYVDQVRKEATPARLYRNDLFRRIQNQRYGTTSSSSRLSLKEIATDVDLAVNTVKAILDGKGSKIENIYRLARYFGVPWAAVFDVDRALELAQREDGTGFDILFRRVGMEIEKTTPKKASRSGKGKA